MAGLKKYRLLWIRSLMLLSTVMLIAVLASWLLVQYNEQKELLARDLNWSLKYAQDKITGKQLYNKYIDPAMQNSEVTINSTQPIHFKQMGNNNSAISVVINTDSKDSLKILDLENHVPKIRGVSDTIISWDHKDRHGKKTVIYRSVNTDSTKEAVKPVLEMILKKLLSEGMTNQLQFQLDTNAVKKIFNAEATKLDQNFIIVWKGAREYYTLKNQKPILLTGTFFKTSYYVTVDNYFLYLSRKIAPQALFVVFLLGITIAAFMFTYNALKEQIRLGIIKNDLISNMSHELKTPISTVKVALEAINNFNPITDNATTRDYLQMATLEMDRLEMLVNQSLNTSLLEEGRITLQREPYDIQQLVGKTLHAMQVRFRQSNAEVEVNVTATDTNASIDVLQMQGVLINLLDNSIKYSGSLPVIHISIGEDDAHIILSIADNGPGIPNEYISKVFDKFFRVPSGDVHNVKGYGLGLSYVKQVVMQHGGTIAVKNLEKGCMFTITFPKINA